jgi:response regulator
MKILVLEDEFSIRSFVTLNLKREGYDVIEAGSGEEAIELFDKNQDINIAVLDVMLPGGIDGFEVLKYIRTRSQNIGIIMLTARTNEEDKVLGLEYGADDYINKPFSPKELIARIRALIRRVTTIDMVKEEVEKVHSGEFTLNFSERKFFKGEEEIELTPKEFEILELFMKNKGKSLSRDEILDRIWGKNYYGDLKVVDVNIRRIRMKIEKDSSNPSYLKTVWGYGYRWEEDEN